MTDRIHVSISLDLFVEDESAMRDAAFARLREAWSSDDDFPYDSAGDLPLDQVVHSLLADSIPAELAGCRRSQLDVESETAGSDDEDSTSKETDDDADGEDDRSDSDDESTAKKDSSDEDAEADDEGDRSDDSDDESTAKKDSSDEDAGTDDAKKDS